MIELLGREHDEVRFRGFRLAPRLVELETTLQAHSAVRAAATRWDSEEKAIVAHLVLDDGPTPSMRELNAWVQQNMSPWILPRRYQIVDRLPLRADGSPDRQVLVDLPSRPLDHDAARKTPHTRWERKLASIWRELLDRDDIGVDDNFFLVGGNRVLGLQMIGRAIAAGIPIAPQTLLHNPTISELAAIAGDTGDDGKGAKPRRRGLAFWQRRTTG
jgi:pimeloyl-ACP methyl ester carboxylesterase